MLLVHAYDWGVREIEGRVNVLAWTLDETSKPHLLRIPYRYECYLELRPLIMFGRRVEWDRLLVSQLAVKIKTSLGPDSGLESYEFVRKGKLYYYQGEKKHPMIKFVFMSAGGINKLRNLVKRPVRFGTKQGPKLIDLNASGILREDSHSPIRRLLTDRDCRYAQWFQIQAREAERKISTVPEWIGDPDTLFPRTDVRTVTCPKIFSFDIECYSDNHRAMPREYIIDHVVFMISCIVFRAGSGGERERYLLVLGEGLEVDGVKVINALDEENLCNAFARLVVETDPDIITGFNIFGFDYPYLYFRLGLYNKSWPNIGRTLDGVTELKEIHWKSSAYSKQNYYMMEASGRVNFDLYTLARREMKLLRYNLDTVARENLGRGKHDVSAVELFSIYERYRDSPGENKEDFLRVARYCVQDAELVADLIEKLNVWIWLTEFSSVTGVSVADLFTRGQQVRCYSLLQDLVIRKGIVMDKVDLPRDKYMGAYVSDPVPGLFEYVVCLDFNSLYPNIIRAYNMCYTTLVRPEEEKGLKDEDIHVVEWDEEDDKGVTRHFRNVFVREHVKRGLLPELLTALIDKRKEVKGLMKKLDPESLEYEVNDKKQLGLKVVANSSYGFTGAKKGYLPLPAIAASVTAMGRKHINECNEYLSKRWGYSVVYNDTDSVFFVVEAGDYSQAWNKGKDLEKEVSDFFPSHLNLEMEKVGRMFCVKKKMYAFWGVDPQGNFVPEDKIMHKGTVLNRRDNCAWQRDFYESVLMGCLNRVPLDEMFASISERVIDLFRRKHPWHDFVIVKSVGDEYKEKKHAMNLFRESLKDKGCPVNAGDRVDFIISDKESHYLGDKMVSPEHFALEECRVDYEYYLEHFGTKNIEKLFNIAHGDLIRAYEDYHRERCAYMALYDFLSKYPGYKSLCSLKGTYFETHQELFEELKRRRIGKDRELLKKLFTDRTKKRLSSYICKNPVRQQFRLILAKKAVMYQIKEMGLKLQ